MSKLINFIVDNLETIIAATGGVSVGLFMLVRKSGNSENDLTPLYLKYKRYTDNIAKSTKSLF